MDPCLVEGEMALHFRRETDAAGRAGHNCDFTFQDTDCFSLLICDRGYCLACAANCSRPSCDQSSLVAPERAPDRLLQIVMNDLAQP